MKNLDALLDLLDQLDAPTRPRLADPTPPAPPPYVPPVTSPRRHDVVAWRRDARLQSWRHETLELAREHAKGLHWATFERYAITCGRDTVEQAVIAVPVGMTWDYHTDTWSKGNGHL